jgi:Cu/Ag efflux protein CusF
MKTLLIPFLAAALFAGSAHAEPGSKSAPAPAASTAAMSGGVVRKIDASAGKITLKHGPIANLDMPPMTMVFRVQPPELLNKVKTGDTVKFRAEDIGGALTVTAIEKVQ